MTELEIKSIVQLLLRGLGWTDTGKRNNCLGFAVCGEVNRVTTYHNIAWPGNFPRDGNDVRGYLWDHIRDSPSMWAIKARAHCDRQKQVVYEGECLEMTAAAQEEGLTLLSDAEFIQRLYTKSRDTTIFLSEFEALVATELLAAHGIELVLAHRPDKGNHLTRWDGSWTNSHGDRVGRWDVIPPGDVKCTTAVICNAEPNVHWERCPTVSPDGGCVQGEKVIVPTNNACRVRHYAYLPHAKDRSALGYPHAQNLSANEQFMLNYFYNHISDMMLHSYPQAQQTDLTHSPKQKATMKDDSNDDGDAMRQAIEASKQEAEAIKAAEQTYDEQIQIAMEQSLKAEHDKHEHFNMVKMTIENSLLRATGGTRVVYDRDEWWDHKCFWHAAIHALGQSTYSGQTAWTEQSLRDATIDVMKVNPFRFQDFWNAIVIDSLKKKDDSEHTTDKDDLKETTPDTWGDYCETLRWEPCPQHHCSDCVFGSKLFSTGCIVLTQDVSMRCVLQAHRHPKCKMLQCIVTVYTGRNVESFHWDSEVDASILPQDPAVPHLLLTCAENIHWMSTARVTDHPPLPPPRTELPRDVRPYQTDALGRIVQEDGMVRMAPPYGTPTTAHLEVDHGAHYLRTLAECCERMHIRMPQYAGDLPEPTTVLPPVFHKLIGNEKLKIEDKRTLPLPPPSLNAEGDMCLLASASGVIMDGAAALRAAANSHLRAHGL